MVDLPQNETPDSHDQDLESFEAPIKSSHSFATKITAVSFICLIIMGNLWFVERFFADRVSNWINEGIQIAAIFTLLSMVIFVGEKLQLWWTHKN